MNKRSVLETFLWGLRKRAHLRYKPLTLPEKRDLTESFIRMVLRHLPEGDWRSAGSQFSNLNGHCERIFFASITDQKFELWVQAAMGIRFTDVEEIWRKSQNLDKNTGHWTVEGVVGNFLRDAQLRYRIDRSKDVEFFEQKISELIEQACLPFWKQFASVADVDREWNKRPFEFDNDATDVLHHATRSVIIAKLAKNPAFEELVTMRRGEVIRTLNISLQKRGLEQFDRLVGWLQNYPI
jgi:hypothetical protein